MALFALLDTELLDSAGFPSLARGVLPSLDQHAQMLFHYAAASTRMQLSSTTRPTIANMQAVASKIRS